MNAMHVQRDLALEWSDDAPTLNIGIGSPPPRRHDEEPTLELAVPYRDFTVLNRHAKPTLKAEPTLEEEEPTLPTLGEEPTLEVPVSYRDLAALSAHAEPMERTAPYREAAPDLIPIDLDLGELGGPGP